MGSQRGRNVTFRKEILSGQILELGLQVSRQQRLTADPETRAHVSTPTGDVDRIYADARSKGVVFNSEPQDQDWGARVANPRDPDGNNLYLLKWLRK